MDESLDFMYNIYSVSKPILNHLAMLLILLIVLFIASIIYYLCIKFMLKDKQKNKNAKSMIRFLFYCMVIVLTFLNNMSKSEDDKIKKELKNLKENEDIILEIKDSPREEQLHFKRAEILGKNYLNKGKYKRYKVVPYNDNMSLELKVNDKIKFKVLESYKIIVIRKG